MTATPGRVLDIVHAAVTATGREVYEIDVQIGHRRYCNGPAVSLHLVGGPPTPAEALAIFAALGIPASQVDLHASVDHKLGTAEAMILGGCDLRVYTQPVPDVPEPSDPTALIVAVDAARDAAS